MSDNDNKGLIMMTMKIHIFQAVGQKTLKLNQIRRYEVQHHLMTRKEE